MISWCGTVLIHAARTSAVLQASCATPASLIRTALSAPIARQVCRILVVSGGPSDTTVTVPLPTASLVLSASSRANLSYSLSTNSTPAVSIAVPLAAILIFESEAATRFTQTTMSIRGSRGGCSRLRRARGEQSRDQDGMGKGPWRPLPGLLPSDRIQPIHVERARRHALA